MKKLLFLLCLLPLGLFAQTTIKPDCSIPFSFTTTASTSNLTCGNNTLGITNWVLVYTSTGFSAISLVVQSAPDVAGAPGSWGTFGGTVLTTSQYPGSSGINPNTSITSANTGLAGYFPWVRINLASITGTGKVTGSLYGFLNSTLSKAGGPGGGGAPTGPCGGDLGGTFPNCTVVNGSHIVNASIPNSGLANPSLTVNGVSCTLGGSCTVTAGGPPTGAAGGDLSGTYPNPTVAKVNGNTPGNTCPGGQFVNAIDTSARGSCSTPSGAGGASIGYSAPAVTLPASGTVFIPLVGGGLPSATETNVQWIAPLTSTFSDLGVLLSAAIGTGNTITVTARDNTTSKSVTCTASGTGAGGTSCTDLTHSFNVTQGDLLDYQIATTGIVTIAPTITIAAEYGGGGTSGGSPGGSFSEYQFRASSSTFGAVTNTGPVPLTGWTPVNFGSQAAISDFSASDIQIGIGNDGGSFALRAYCRSIPSAPYAVIMSLDLQAWRNAGGAEAGYLLLYDGTKSEGIGVQFQPAPLSQIDVATFPNSSTFGSVLAATAPFFLSRVTLKVSDDGTTNRIWSYWSSGAFVPLLTETTGSFLTPSNLCFGGFSDDQTTQNNPVITADLKYLCLAASTTCNGN